MKSGFLITLWLDAQEGVGNINVTPIAPCKVTDHNGLLQSLLPIVSSRYFKKCFVQIDDVLKCGLFHNKKASNKSNKNGCTSDPREYSGPIGKQLAGWENKTAVSFCAVAGNLPDLPKNVVDELSTDQKYLYEICQTVSTGSCSPELANRQPGKMVHSRWLTSANRIHRHYELALRRIIKVREAESSTKRRIFKPPKINFSARDYTEIIVWHEWQVTPPPVL
ncbi:hypothetical protein ILUMI_24067 [Ignelater luminosus]|uniref:Uncharacterized protein n=1 Tax=Ignelater luminosus TaxID=2038154 RepID=A0A8K0FWP6_IGNLU|nr:hypothetical protein ILUMI_24067 [Ignelater luminosus]